MSRLPSFPCQFSFELLENAFFCLDDVIFLTFFTTTELSWLIWKWKSAVLYMALFGRSLLSSCMTEVYCVSTSWADILHLNCCNWKGLWLFLMFLVLSWPVFVILQAGSYWVCSTWRFAAARGEAAVQDYVTSVRCLWVLWQWSHVTNVL